ncbi:DNA cytosine methyltransferase [Streptococcus suis]|nr:DNA cytosine methyltransferase [Streptococcus suis]
MKKIIDLFAGAGGLSLGFEQEGFIISKAVENNKWATETYVKNHHDGIEVLDNIIDLHLDDKDIDVIIGGPPCQGFSNANRNKSSFINNNNLLVKEYFRIIKEVTPKMFVMENVNSILSDTHLFFLTKQDQIIIEQLEVDIKEKVFSFAEFSETKEIITKYLQSVNMDDASVNWELFPLEMLKILKVLYRKKDKQDYFVNNAEKLSKLCSTFQLSDVTLENYRLDLEDAATKKTFSTEVLDTIRKIIDYSKATEFLTILLEKELLFKINPDLTVVLKSYSVNEYITKIVSEDYYLHPFILDASDFGIPQKRKRYLLVGLSKNYFKDDIEFNFLEYRDNRFTISDAIKDLESVPTSFEVNSLPVYGNETEEVNDYSKDLRDSESIYNHIITESRDNAINRFKALQPGQNFHDLSKELKQTYADATRTQNTIYQRLDYNKKSGTVVNVRKSMWVHPTIDRAISIREAARLQSFPDSFIFYGTKDAQYQQVGNAVPPKLARIIAKKCTQMLSSLK